MAFSTTQSRIFGMKGNCLVFNAAGYLLLWQILILCKKSRDCFLTNHSELHTSLQTAEKTIQELKQTQTQQQQQITKLCNELQQIKSLHHQHHITQQNEINEIKQQISTTNCANTLTKVNSKTTNIPK